MWGKSFPAHRIFVSGDLGGRIVCIHSKLKESPVSNIVSLAGHSDLNIYL